ncbi:hypothetical protein B0H14DRAFT_2562839 [Mycena olivaceomarginata]|nr:hypothetical protein B0H14DRAFT_2562839 [Mycena olivaceomarginata]
MRLACWKLVPFAKRMSALARSFGASVVTQQPSLTRVAPRLRHTIKCQIDMAIMPDLPPNLAPHLSSQTHSNLFSLAHSKLNLSTNKNSFSLHRWVLLKDAVIQSLHHVSTSSPCQAASSSSGKGEAEAESFMFPNASKLIGGLSSEVNASEATWLDLLLETLGDDDDNEFSADPVVNVSVVPVDKDKDLPQSPPISPISEFATNYALQHLESQCRQTIDSRSFTSLLGLEGLLNSLESSDPQQAVFDQ